MQTTNNLSFGGQVEQVRRRFEQWRRRHPGRCRLTQSLWSAAAKLAQHYGLNHAARTLRLSYYSLKEHLPVADAAEARTQILLPKFVELRPYGSATLPECSLELENGRGAKMKMKMELTGAAVSELSTPARHSGARDDSNRSPNAHPGGGRGGGFLQRLDGLAGICKQQLEADPFSGWLFVFHQGIESI